MRCVVTDFVEPDLEWEAEKYRDAGVDFSAHQLRFAPIPELVDSIRDADVLVVDQTRITAEVIDGLPECRLIIRHGDGYDNLDLDAATTAGIACANKPGFWSQEVAEHTLALAVALLLRLPVQQRIAADPFGGPGGRWNLDPARPHRRLGTIEAGVVGFGKVGRHVVRLFRAVFGRVLVHDPFISEDEIRAAGAEPVSLDALLSAADVVSLHVPLNDASRKMINAERIATMKVHACLINTARGSAVDTDAVTEALTSGHLDGVALDVTDPEPLPPDHPLFANPRAIVTPHLAWYSEDASWAMRKSIVSDVIAATHGALPATIVNPDVLSSSALRNRMR